MRGLKYVRYVLVGVLFLSLAGCIPIVKITAPQNGATFGFGDVITFTGTGRDIMEGDLTGSSLVWESSIDGPIGTGISIATSTLQQGVHTITLSATNSNNQTGTANITITVGEPPFVVISDDIDSNTTWEGGTIYVIKAFDFWVNATLEIEPGAIIKFDPSEGPAMNVDGTVIANGTPAEPIIFTAYKDDEHGGDTNGDGSVTAPLPGDWDGIYIQNNGSVFSYCEFYYGGDTVLEPWDCIATITNATFAHNSGSALDASTALTGTVITGNTFFDNERPLYINTTFDLDDSNTFENPDDPSETNTYNGVFVEYPDDIGNHISWEETDVAFVLDDNDLWVLDYASLTLGDTVVVKFTPDSTINHYGNIFSGTNVFFTSYKDDDYKGDTNGDGSLTTPMDGDWNGIYNDTTFVYEAWPNILYDEIH